MSKKKMTDESLFKSIRPQDTQIGGTHYKGFAIQPYEFISKNNLNFFQGVCIKYIIRYLKKGKVEDLKKVKHYCDLEIKRLEEK